MDKINFDNLPSNYSVCTFADCPLASTCLHQLAYYELAGRTDFLRLISPRLCSKDEKCSRYRDNMPQRYARGFTKMQDHMLTTQFRRFKILMMSRYPRSTYYALRSGKVLLSPKEQNYILGVLRKIGITEDLKFDSYENTVVFDE